MSIEKIREALAAGPSAGLWVYSTDNQGTFQVAIVERFGVYSEHSEYGGREVGEPEADARFIAACNPAAIHDLLAHIDAQAAEIERLRAVLIAAKELNAESEEYDFGYGLGRGAPNSYWEHLDDALDAVIAHGAPAALWREG